jgi:hypothetical protein
MLHMSYFLALLAIAVGCVFVIKTDWFLNNFGRIGWAEQHLGTEGGSRLMYKLIGLAIIIIALMAVTGFLGTIITGIFGNLVPKPM